MTGKKFGGKESERGLAWRFFCEQKKEEISFGIRELLKTLVYFVLFASAVIILCWINWVIVTSIAPLDCSMQDVTEPGYGVCGLGHVFVTILATIIGVLGGVALLAWLLGDWDSAKYRAKEKLRGNRK